MRLIMGLVVGLMAVSQPLAQQVEDAWRATITGQIEAFRSGDGEAALEFAGAGFKTIYTDPERFMADLGRAGYGPIVESRSHSFGAFEEVGEDRVAQIVNIVGPDQKLYQALYRLRNEPDEGWRVEAVIMQQSQGMGV